MLWDFIIDNNIATEKEVGLVTDINGWNEKTMNDIIEVRTGYHDYEQCVDDDEYVRTEELDDYYGLNEEDEEEED